jgi:uncharacterized protein DUF1579
MQRFVKMNGRVIGCVSIVAVVSIGLLCVTKCVAAEDQSKPAKAKDLLARNAGTWDCEIKMFFKGPKAPPTIIKGVEENKLVAGGKFLQTSFRYPMGRRGEFEGHGLTGYDSRSNRIVGTWVDSMTSVPSRVNEEFDEKTNTLTDHRTVIDGAGNEMQSKHVITWLDNSTKKHEIFMVASAGGKDTEIKLLEMTATKRK